MNRRFIMGVILVIIACCLLLTSLTLYATSVAGIALPGMNTAEVTPTPVPETPTPIPTPKPELTAQGPLPVLQARIAYLVDMQNGHVLYDIHGEQAAPMASTTKIMTAMIAIQTGNLDQEITVKRDAYLHVIELGSSNAGLVPGEQFTLRELLYGLMLPSGGDAAIAISDALAGSPENFVVRMNLFASRLHLFQTHYTNVDGLTSEDTHYSSAVDLVKLASYALNNPVFRQIVDTPKYTLSATSQHGAHIWTNTNTLLNTYKGMLGIKTGHTDLAGYCLVFEAQRDGHSLIGVVLNSPDQAIRDQDVTKLLDWGFGLPMKVPAL